MPADGGAGIVNAGGDSEHDTPAANEERHRLLPRLSSRDEYMDFFESDGGSSVAGLTAGQLTHGLAKSYILETVRHDVGESYDARNAFRAAGHSVTDVGDGEDLVTVEVPGEGIIAIVEGIDGRYPVLHTALRASESDALVRKMVNATPVLDHVWLAGRFFDAMWEWTRRSTPPHRLARLKFNFKALYENLGAHDVEPDPAADDFDDDDSQFREQRKSQLVIEEEVSALSDTLAKLRGVHGPTYSTVSLRVPASRRGGFEVYNNGKVTNRSDSFAEHRDTISLVTELYSDLVEATEDSLWVAAEDAGDDGYRMVGAPVYLKFARPLSAQIFETWVARTFGPAQNTFRLGGQPIRTGEHRVHVYGVDRHLWSPIDIEASRSHIVALIPRGTCGNTVNRLITNVQQFLDPEVEAWIGDRPYSDVIESSPSLTGAAAV